MSRLLSVWLCFGCVAPRLGSRSKIGLMFMARRIAKPPAGRLSGSIPEFKCKILELLPTNSVYEEREENCCGNTSEEWLGGR